MSLSSLREVESEVDEWHAVGSDSKGSRASRDDEVRKWSVEFPKEHGVA